MERDPEIGKKPVHQLLSARELRLVHITPSNCLRLRPGVPVIASMLVYAEEADKDIIMRL